VPTDPASVAARGAADAAGVAEPLGEWDADPDGDGDAESAPGLADADDGDAVGDAVSVGLTEGAGEDGVIVGVGASVGVHAGAVAVLVLEQPPTSSNTALAQAREVRFMMLPASHRAARRAGSDAGEAPETASDGSPTRAAERSR
jgi:hypothetical protein